MERLIDSKLFIILSQIFESRIIRLIKTLVLKSLEILSHLWRKVKNLK